jgi:hypothetical protein
MLLEQLQGCSICMLTKIEDSLAQCVVCEVAIQQTYTTATISSKTTSWMSNQCDDNETTLWCL